MSAPHIEGCDGNHCEDFACGLCDCCSFDFGTPKRVKMFSPHGPKKRLCDLCMGTSGSEWSDEIRFIGYVGNSILEAMPAVFDRIAERITEELL